MDEDKLLVTVLGDNLEAASLRIVLLLGAFSVVAALFVKLLG
ncbi:hypothetical protein [Radicibacter daui]